MSRENKGKTGKSAVKKWLTLKRRENLAGYMFVMPWIIGLLVFVLRPVAQSFYFSLSRVRMTPKGRLIDFIRMENYTQILQTDPNFITELGSYLVKTVIASPVIVVFALIIALLLNSKIKGKGFFRLIFFLPVIISSGPVMKQLVDQGAGSIPSINMAVISSIVGFLPQFVEDAILALFANIVMYLWYSGIQILIFLAAIQKIDLSLYEAAKIDGGSTWECFWKITLPTIKNMTLLNVVYTIIFLSNNEQNNIIETIKNAMFSATGNKGYGYASAMAWLYALIVTLLVLTFAAVLVLKKDAYAKQVQKAKKDRKHQEKLLRQIKRRDIKYEKQKAKRAAKSLRS